MTIPDTYKHLDDSQPLTLSLSVDAIAEELVRLNYGVHRVLSSIIRYRLAKDPSDELALGIKALLNEGLV